MHRSLTRLLLGPFVALFVALAAAQDTGRKPPSRILSAPAPQQPSQQELKERRDQKLQKEVFKLAAWGTDFDAARAEAKQTGKLLLVYFTRSYSH